MVEQLLQSGPIRCGDFATSRVGCGRHAFSRFRDSDLQERNGSADRPVMSICRRLLSREISAVAACRAGREAGWSLGIQPASRKGSCGYLVSGARTGSLA